MKTLLLLLFLCLPLVGRAEGDLFERANNAYATGQLEEARQLYTQQAQSGPLHANLFYNLGNTETRLGNREGAFLAYERALALAPNHPDAAASLSRLREASGASVETPLPLLQRVLLLPQSATAYRAPWLAALAFWGLLFCLAPRFWRGRIAWWRGAFCLIAFLWCTTAVVTDALRGPLWLVTAKLAPARETPLNTAKTVANLPLGSRLRLLSERGEWLFVRLPDRTTGWVARREVQPIRPG